MLNFWVFVFSFRLLWHFSFKYTMLQFDFWEKLRSNSNNPILFSPKHNICEHEYVRCCSCILYILIKENNVFEIRQKRNKLKDMSYILFDFANIQCPWVLNLLFQQFFIVFCYWNSLIVLFTSFCLVNSLNFKILNQVFVSRNIQSKLIVFFSSEMAIFRLEISMR